MPSSMCSMATSFCGGCRWEVGVEVEVAAWVRGVLDIHEGIHTRAGAPVRRPPAQWCSAVPVPRQSAQRLAGPS